MEITTRDLITVMHGMGFGALFMLAFSAAIAGVYRISDPSAQSAMSAREHAVLTFALVAMVVLAWLSALS